MGIVTNRRRVMGGKRLPYDAEVEYLRSSGTQWIDTGIVPTAQTNIAIKFLTTYLSGSDSLGIFGCRVASNNKSFLLLQYKNGNSNLFRWDYSNSLYNIVSVTSGWHIATNDRASITLDGTRYARTTQFSPTTNKIFLFCVNQNGSPFILHTALDIASFSVTENGVVILDLIPVRVGQVGYMYDKVSGQLFGNAGTGDFIVGPDKN